MQSNATRSSLMISTFLLEAKVRTNSGQRCAQSEPQAFAQIWDRHILEHLGQATFGTIADSDGHVSQ